MLTGTGHFKIFHLSENMVSPCLLCTSTQLFIHSFACCFFYITKPKKSLLLFACLCTVLTEGGSGKKGHRVGV